MDSKSIHSFGCIAAVSILLVATPVAASHVTYFDFQGWNHAAIAGGGQLFTDVFEDVDVVVSAVGDFSIDSKFSAGFIRDGLRFANEMNEYRFIFSRSIPIIVNTATIDASEQIRIFGIGSEVYFHGTGALPTISPIGSGIKMVGNGFGSGPGGAARGETHTFAQLGTATLRVQHRSLLNNKFEQFRIGTPTAQNALADGLIARQTLNLVPEPGCGALLGIGLLSASLWRRKDSV